MDDSCYLFLQKQKCKIGETCPGQTRLSFFYSMNLQTKARVHIRYFFALPSSIYRVPRAILVLHLLGADNTDQGSHALGRVDASGLAKKLDIVARRERV